jgi:RNA recognition motif-containing protein
MIRMFAGGLPPDMTERELGEIFSAHGKVRGMKLVMDVFSGKCKGFGFVEMEGHEARAAMVALNGKELRGSRLKVNEEKKEADRGRGGPRRR